MTSCPDDEDDGFVETVWPGEGSWTGPVEVAHRPAYDGDVFFTLPRVAFGLGQLRDDGSRGEVVVPMELILWVAGLVEFWGVKEVAEQTGLRIGTISSYHGRRQMPPPDKVIDGRPYWRPDVIMSWRAAVESKRTSRATDS